MIRPFEFQATDDLLNSTLCDEKSFYQQFIQDLKDSKEEVIIESPFIATKRMKLLTPIFFNLINRGVKVYVITRNPKEHSYVYEQQSETEIQKFEAMGVNVLISRGNHHRKLAIIDRKILWEGSLNILSQINSREIMRRIKSKYFAKEMFDFLNLQKSL